MRSLGTDMIGKPSDVETSRLLVIAFNLRVVIRRLDLEMKQKLSEQALLWSNAVGAGFVCSLSAL